MLIIKYFRVNADAFPVADAFKIKVVVYQHISSPLLTVCVGLVMSLFGAVLTFALLSAPPTEAADSSYVAAVYEHRVVLNPEPRVPLSRLEALQHLQKNLDIYEVQAARAAQQVPAAHDGWTLSRVTSFSIALRFAYLFTR